MEEVHVQDYSDLLDGIYNSGFILLTMGVAKRTRIIDALCDSHHPVTSQEIADLTNQKERYVRELLNALAAARVILVDRETGRYWLTSGQKTCLRQTSDMATSLFLVVEMEPLLRDCFRADGPQGITFNELPAFFDWYQAFRASKVEHTIEAEILPQLHSSGVTAKLESGMKVVDIGCGEGTYALALARRFPQSEFVGLDDSEKGIAMANKQKQERGLTNVSFQTGDAENLPVAWTETFDLVFMYDVLHDLADPYKGLSEIRRVMKDDGWLALVEMNFHANPADNVGNLTAAMCYWFSLFTCLPSSLSRPPHVGYGACWGVENVEEALKGTKFDIHQKSIPDMRSKTNVYYMCRKQA